MNELLVYWNTYSFLNPLKCGSCLWFACSLSSTVLALFCCYIRFICVYEMDIYIYLIIYLFIFRYFSFGQSENAQAQAHVIIVIKAKPYHLTHETQTHDNSK